MVYGMKKKFTEEQEQVIRLKKGIHLVLAPPGCGKTEILAIRVQRAIEEYNYNPSDMACLTFTNKAAREMEERIEEVCDTSGMFVGNIHRYCIEFLKKNNLISISTSIIDEEEAGNILDELKEDYYSKYRIDPEKISNGSILKVNNSFLWEKIGLSEILTNTDSFIAKEVAKLYRRVKKEHSFLDFDDLLARAYFYLSKSDRNFFFSNFKWIQADEVQDLNPIQWGLINLMTDKDSLQVFFGDYQQAIYSFMGAKVESLNEIKEKCSSYDEYPNNDIHRLSQKFRSSPCLIEMCNKYAKELLKSDWEEGPISNSIKTTDEKDLQIKIVNGTTNDEARTIISDILPVYTINDEELTAILVRTNRTADIIDSFLKSRYDKDYFKISGFDLLRLKSIKGLFAFLNVMNNEFDKISWTRVFYEFGILYTLRESRNFISELHKMNIFPTDLIKYNLKSTELIEFKKNFYNSRLIVFDTETTGLDTRDDDIIQIAAIELINGKIGEKFEIYLKTEKDIKNTEGINRISRAILEEKGVEQIDGLKRFMNFINKSDVSLCAHNLEFDIDILSFNLKRYLNIDMKVPLGYDTLRISKILFQELKSYELGSLISNCDLDIKNENYNFHNASDDVEATLLLLLKLIETIEQNENAILERLNDKQMNKVLSKLSEKFVPLYNSILLKMDDDVLLQEVIDDYFQYARIHTIIEDEEYKKREKRSRETYRLYRL